MTSAKTLLQVLLCSVIGRVSSETDQKLLNSRSTVERPSEMECHNNEEVARWINDQVLLESLTKIRGDLLEKLKELQKKAEQLSQKFQKDKHELKDKQTELEKQLKEVDDRIEKLEREESSSTNSTNGTASCCEEIQKKLHKLIDEVEAEKNETRKRANQIKEHIQNMQKDQKEQDGQIIKIKETVEIRDETLKKVYKNCEKNCEPDGEEKNICNADQLEARVARLEKQIQDLLNQEGKLTTAMGIKNNQSLTPCRGLQEKVAQLKKLHDQLENIQAGKCNSNKEFKARIKDLEQQLQDLEAQMEKAKSCCKRLEELTKHGNELHLNLKKMNNNYGLRMKELESDMKDLKDRLDAAMQRTKDLNSTKLGNQSEAKDLRNRIEQLQNSLNEIKNNLENLSLNASDIREQLDKLRKDVEEKFGDFNGLFVAHTEAVEEFTKNIESRLGDLENRLRNKYDKKLEEVLQRLTRLQNIYDELVRHGEKLLEFQKRIDEMESKLKSALSKLQEMDEKVEKCSKICANSPLLQEVLRRLEALEQKVADGSIFTTPKPPRPTQKLFMTSALMTISSFAKCWLLLLLLSLPSGSAAFRLNLYGWSGYFVPHGVAPSAVAPRSQTHMTEKECHDYNEIARWINDGLVQTARLTDFNQRLGKMLGSLNVSATQEHCCFYEPYTMNRIFEDINSLAKVNGTTKPSGDLGQDLDTMLDAMRKLLTKSFSICCEQLHEELMRLKEDLLAKLEDLKKNAEQHADMSAKDKLKLKQRQADLEKQVKDVMDRMEKLEHEKNTTATEVAANAKCCEELEKRLHELNEKLQKEKNEAHKKASQVEEQVQDLQSQQNQQSSKIANIKDTAERHNETIENVYEKCERTCGPDKGSTNANLCNTDQLEEKITKLEKQVQDLLNQINQLTTVAETNNGKRNHTLNTCTDLQEKLAELPKLYEQLENIRAGICEANEQLQERIKNLEQQLEDLQAQLERTKDFCSRIEGLAKDSEQVRQNLVELNNSYDSHIKQLEGDMGDLTKRLDAAMELLKHLNATSQVGQDAEKDLEHRIEKLQAELNKTKLELNPIKDIASDLLEQLQKLQHDTEEQFADLANILIAHIQDTEEVNRKLEQRLDEVEKKLQQKYNKKLEEILQRLTRLEKLYQQLMKDMNDLSDLEKRIEELEKQLNDALEKLKGLEDKVRACTDKCADWDKLNDILARLEKLEKYIKEQNPLAITHRPARRTTKRVSWVGGIDANEDLQYRKHPNIVYE
ncbi:putative leucine-rich repeat-containing protein DDB_G0290503 [Scaptodrosophila lebanonensis]|uniref:Leucine-rich repeat-containing protein DDB_G0290503 n=1 Tax=Drosophila lebanonensis TaxID=7225 RepID=A0A6J2UC09_DROLE|nr:putative leucine-rich repeat-containing protein DDB_G0290503 [Scaptodrosophila lebanonensis]